MKLLLFKRTVLYKNQHLITPSYYHLQVTPAYNHDKLISLNVAKYTAQSN